MPALVNVGVELGEGFNKLRIEVHADPHPDRQGERLLTIRDRITGQTRALPLTPEFRQFLRDVAG